MNMIAHPDPTHAISILPVWAWLVIHGHKDFENRSWRQRNPARRFLQSQQPLRIYIHAGGRNRANDYDEAQRVLQWVNSKRLAQDLAPIALPPRGELHTGGIIGSVTAGQYQQRDYANPWSICSGFPLSDPEPLPFRPVKGQLGFFIPKF